MSRRLAWAVIVLCVVLWGINATALKVAMRPLSGEAFDPVFLSGLRFCFVAPLLALGLGWQNRSLLHFTRRELAMYACFGLASMLVGEILQAFAVRYTSVANLTLLSHGTIPLSTALWARGLYGEEFGKKAFLGAGIALIGVALVATHAPGGLHFGGATWRGDTMALLRAALHGGFLTLLGKQLATTPALKVTLGNVGFGALWSLPYVLWRGSSFAWAAVAPQTWLAVFWTAVPTTLFGFVAWNAAVGKVGTVAATSAMYALPFAAALGAFALIHEPITLWHVLGGGLIITGILLTRKRNAKRSSN
ncbi:MAG: DMT family transporter [Armatimonadetes bacterium]|nr:DMT family transporter [Armatimonadota bacterium]